MIEEPSDFEILAELEQRRVANPRLDSYIDRLQQRKGPRTYVEEIALQYIKSLKWTNDTLDKDLKLFWMACHQLFKNRPTQFRDILEWAAKNRVHPRAFVKVARKVIPLQK